MTQAIANLASDILSLLPAKLAKEVVVVVNAVVGIGAAVDFTALPLPVGVKAVIAAVLFVLGNVAARGNVKQLVT